MRIPLPLKLHIVGYEADNSVGGDYCASSRLTAASLNPNNWLAACSEDVSEAQLALCSQLDCMICGQHGAAVNFTALLPKGTAGLKDAPRVAKWVACNLLFDGCYCHSRGLVIVGARACNAFGVPILATPFRRIHNKILTLDNLKDLQPIVNFIVGYSKHEGKHDHAMPNTARK